ncbi:AraC family transcriptional regulator [Pseudarthrobacter sp. SSS035]|uniref:helix-turn-helix domain-containing protein n=1 Tax=Pseudarthrobacter sp. SSS035 TaxID=2931399 RepID=UPI00200C5C94|nr:AraC family transcriptional regulator [Pseudarthrobacter sp. SSS035]
MLASYEHIVQSSSLSWRIQRIHVQRFEAGWHFHPELELTYICQGAGTRIVGDSVEAYEPGDLTLIGPDLPHTYVSEPGSAVHEAIVVQFRRDFLGPGFFEGPEFTAAAVMLDRASRGLSFSNTGISLVQLEQLAPAERTIALLGLLVDLSRADAKQLASDHGSPAISRAAAERISGMIGLMQSDYYRKLTLEDIAAAGHLSPSAANRLFRRSTGSTIIRYLNLIRVNAACRLLRDTNQSIASVAADCGFENLSNFNRRFREIRNSSPRDYRRSFHF